jgi:exonuclease SbcD
LKVVHFADLHLGVETYGRPDPATGLSSRLLDFLAALDQLVDYALENKVDLVLFCGDAYKSREPTPTQQRELARRINRLAQGGVPVFLLTGNHDLPNAFGRATATEIFDTLAIQRVHVSSHPDVYRIPTESGPLQIVTLPWLRRSALLSKEETKDLDFSQINQRMQEILTGIVAASVQKLDPDLPAILAAHVWVVGAQVGSESGMTIGQEHTLLLSNIAHPAFDYVALGHIHRHQVLQQQPPPVVYAGSLERVNFGEEADDKGFYVVDIETDKESGQRQVAFDFHPIAGRRFLTLNVNIEPGETDPTAAVTSAIAGQAESITDSIVRLNISLPAELENQLRESELRSALKEAHYFTIARDVKRESRLRLGNTAAEELTPLEALKAYLSAKKVAPERAQTLLDYGEKLIAEQSTREKPAP